MFQIADWRVLIADSLEGEANALSLLRGGNALYFVKLAPAWAACPS
jgi:hypothetical protein